VWNESPPKDDLLRTFQNNNYMLQALAVRLYARPRLPVNAVLDEVSESFAEIRKTKRSETELAAIAEGHAKSERSRNLGDNCQIVNSNER